MTAVPHPRFSRYVALGDSSTEGLDALPAGQSFQRGVVPNWRLGTSSIQVQSCTMSTLTVPLPDEDLAFLRAYSKAQGISAEALLARQARSLREQLQRPVHSEVTAASGIISANVAANKSHQDHLAAKHS